MKRYAFLLLWLASALVSYARDYDFVVAQDGSGDFTTLTEAIRAVPDYRKGDRTRIFIRRGTYREKVVIPESKGPLGLYGEEGTVISWDDFAQRPNRFGENIGTSGSATLYVFAPDFVAEDITFENTAGPVGQAVAVHVASDRVVFRRCRFLGHQDTLYTFGELSRQYYEDCYVEGTVDYIFGKAQAVFVRCQLHNVGDGYVTAPATPPGRTFGYVFVDCRLTAADGVKRVFLSRPWRPFAQCVYIRCDMGGHIVPEGWNNWGNKANERTAYYAEFGSTGPGANAEARASWSHQLPSAAAYDPATLLAGSDHWNPDESR